MELDGNKETGYRISGAGKIDDADVSWQKISASARGSYRFTDEEITFDPLIIRKAGTDMVIRGKWGKKSLGIFMKGTWMWIRSNVSYPSLPGQWRGASRYGNPE